MFHASQDFPGGSDGKESACNVEDPGSIPRLGRSPREGNGNHSGIPAWKIPWIEEPRELQSMGPEIEPTSLVSPALAGRFFTTSNTWKAQAEYAEHIK